MMDGERYTVQFSDRLGRWVLVDLSCDEPVGQPPLTFWQYDHAVDMARAMNANRSL
jgi:hypothetical protein